MTGSLLLRRLDAIDFRNLTRLTLEPGRRFTVLFGDNGQGKTNILEAIAFGCTGKSFRTAKLPELVRTACERADLRLRLEDSGDERVQDATIRGGTRELRIDGRRAVGIAAYALRTPVVVFHPGVLELSQGPGQPRRQLIDRLSLHAEPALEDALIGHAKAQRARLHVLTSRGSSARELDAYEALIVRHGLRIFEARARVCAALLPMVEAVHARLTAGGEPLTIAYNARESDAESFLAKLVERRTVDAVRGMATVGPQRDDLEIALSGRGARGHASQGQHRTIALALKLAEVELTTSLRALRPLVLLDDVSSELDRSRTAQLFEHLAREASQVFLTTTRAELIATPEGVESGDRADVEVRAGEAMPTRK